MTRAIGWQRFEAAVVAIAVVVLTVQLDYAWWWLFALFLAVDLSALPYVVSPKAGAVSYNLVHAWAGPAALAVAGAIADSRPLVLGALCWTFHVAVDRTVGYGFKSTHAFHETHLSPEHR
jgi:hypothetical protein